MIHVLIYALIYALILNSGVSHRESGFPRTGLVFASSACRRVVSLCFVMLTPFVLCLFFGMRKATVVPEFAAPVSLPSPTYLTLGRVFGLARQRHKCCFDGVKLCLARSLVYDSMFANERSLHTGLQRCQFLRHVLAACRAHEFFRHRFVRIVWVSSAGFDESLEDLVQTMYLIMQEMAQMNDMFMKNTSNKSSPYSTHF